MAEDDQRFGLTLAGCVARVFNRLPLPRFAHHKHIHAGLFQCLDLAIGTRRSGQEEDMLNLQRWISYGS